MAKQLLTVIRVKLELSMGQQNVGVDVRRKKFR